MKQEQQCDSVGVRQVPVSPETHLQQQQRLLFSPLSGGAGSFGLKGTNKPTGFKSFSFSFEMSVSVLHHHSLFADLQVFLVVKVGAKAEVLQVDGLVFAFVWETSHLLRGRNLDRGETTENVVFLVGFTCVSSVAPLRACALTGGGLWFRGMRPDGVSASTVKWGVGGGPMGNGRLSASTW